MRNLILIVVATLTITSCQKNEPLNEVIAIEQEVVKEKNSLTAKNAGEKYTIYNVGYINGKFHAECYGDYTVSYLYNDYNSDPQIIDGVPQDVSISLGSDYYGASDPGPGTGMALQITFSTQEQGGDGSNGNSYKYINFATRLPNLDKWFINEKTGYFEFTGDFYGPGGVVQAMSIQGSFNPLDEIYREDFNYRNAVIGNQYTIDWGFVNNNQAVVEGVYSRKDINSMISYDIISGPYGNDPYTVAYPWADYAVHFTISGDDININNSSETNLYLWYREDGTFLGRSRGILGNGDSCPYNWGYYGQEHPASEDEEMLIRLSH